MQLLEGLCQAGKEVPAVCVHQHTGLRQVKCQADTIRQQACTCLQFEGAWPIVEVLLANEVRQATEFVDALVHFAKQLHDLHCITTL